ncbi:MAG: CocE/NonD family hydrolase, partial [Frankia sp.]|nr:CocE/NonD family hydrolase [Frankia sp.]
MTAARVRTPIRTLVALALLVGALAVPRAHADPQPNDYVTMSDGTSIAVGVHFPKGYKPGKRYPAVLDMSGYEGASANGYTMIGDTFGEYQQGHEVPLATDSMVLTKPYLDRGYIAVHASVRGTGCSGGEFDLFSWRAALDGREVIEWMAAQGWSNHKVALVGHSYSGITGFMIAASRPPHLVAAALSGLIDDLYRGLVYPGGVSNLGFPVAWTGAVRPAYDVLGGTGQG